MGLLTAKKSADCFLAFCNEHGDYLCNLKLQKLLYYSQGWFLAQNDQPLFDEQIEAWIHGPVVPSVYRQFKLHGFSPIVSTLTPADSELADVPAEVWDHIKSVWVAYGDFTGFDLERLSHNEVPWLNARKGLPPDAPSNNVITHEDMKAYFSSLSA